MDNFIKKVINEEFASKAQQRYFYAKANDKKTTKKDRKKWTKWAKEFSDDTDFKKIPEKVDEIEGDVDEIVDEKGNFITGKERADVNTKGITSKSTTDQAIRTSSGQMGSYGTSGTQTTIKYWAEADMSKALGAEDTIEDDMPFKKAYNHFTKTLGLSPEEAKERMAQLGYDEKLGDDKVRLVENPKKFIEEYIDSLLSKKATDNELVKKDEEVSDESVNPIVKRQIKALKNTLEKNGLSIKKIMKYFDNEEPEKEEN